MNNLLAKFILYGLVRSNFMRESNMDGKGIPVFLRVKTFLKN